MGFTAELLEARVRRAADLSAPRTHALVLVTLPEGPYLADVGFGAHSSYPLRYDSRDRQDDPGGLFSLADAPDGDVDVARDGQRQYRYWSASIT